jgi:hypothetical protein
LGARYSIGGIPLGISSGHAQFDFRIDSRLWIKKTAIAHAIVEGIYSLLDLCCCEVCRAVIMDQMDHDRYCLNLAGTALPLYLLALPAAFEESVELEETRVLSLSL